MKKLIEKLTHTALTVSEFLTLMEKYNFPFTVDKSRIADFYISSGDTVSDIRIVIGIPDCFEVAKYILEMNHPDLLKAIEEEDTSILHVVPCKNLNYRDILIELTDTMYVNYWELHMNQMPGDPQNMALMALARHGYINENILDFKHDIVHNHVNEYLRKFGVSLRYDEEFCDKITRPTYFTYYDFLSEHIKAKVNAFCEYQNSIGNTIDNKKEYFWRHDMNGKITGAISPENAIKYLKD